jgi:hypothetical protein
MCRAVDNAVGKQVDWQDGSWVNRAWEPILPFLVKDGIRCLLFLNARLLGEEVPFCRRLGFRHLESGC